MNQANLHINNLGRIPASPVVPQLRGEGFQGLLQDARQTLDPEKIKFSSHALERIESRNLTVSQSDKARLGSAMENLASKNVKDGLVIIDDKRFVVSVTNKTVITIMSSGDRDVYTNIQGVAFN